MPTKLEREFLAMLTGTQTATLAGASMSAYVFFCILAEGEKRKGDFHVHRRRHYLDHYSSLSFSALRHGKVVESALPPQAKGGYWSHAAQRVVNQYRVRSLATISFRRRQTEGESVPG